MIISGGKVFGGAGFDARDVYVEGGAFAEEPIGECSPGQTIDASNCWVIPGPVSYTHLDVYKRQVKHLVKVEEL